MKRTIAILLSAVLILPLLGCNKTQDNIPQLLRDLGVKISSETTQQINYQLWGSSDTVTSQYVRYKTKDGQVFGFDEAGNLISFSAGDSNPASHTANFHADQITKEYIDSLLSAYIPDSNEFGFSETPVSTEYGYDVMLYKNIDTVCEDCIVLQLGFFGELRAFNIRRSGISDPAEVDAAYFSSRLAAILENISDKMISYEVVYQKIDGVVVATYSVEFEDPYGGRYVNVYTIAGYAYIVMEVTESNLIVAEIGEDGKAIETKQYSVPNWFHPSTEIEVDYKISITHSGSILETFPMQFAEIYKMEYYDKETGLSTVVIPD